MADFKIKSAAGTGNKTLIQSQDQSGSDYAIEVGSSGALGSLKPSSIKTTTNSYDAIKVAELNSLGYLNHNFFGCSYYLSSTFSAPSGAHTEVTGTWSKIVTSGASGSDDADMFGKFSSGRWTPTVSGYYFCAYSAYIPNIDNGEWIVCQIKRNGAGTDGTMVGYARHQAASDNADQAISGAGIVALDTNDYVSLFVYHNEGGAQNMGATSNFSVTYLGTSDL